MYVTCCAVCLTHGYTLHKIPTIVQEIGRDFRSGNSKLLDIPSGLYYCTNCKTFVETSEEKSWDL